MALLMGTMIGWYVCARDRQLFDVIYLLNYLIIIIINYLINYLLKINSFIYFNSSVRGTFVLYSIVLS